MILKSVFSLHKAYRNTSEKIASLSRSFSWAVCAEKDMDNLKECYRQAETIRVQFGTILSQKNIEFCFLADLFEVCDGFSKFSDLMKFWANVADGYENGGYEEEDDRSRYQRSFMMFKAAAKFDHHFEKLPSLIQRMSNFGLSHHKSAIINLIEQGSTEFVRTSQDYGL